MNEVAFVEKRESDWKQLTYLTAKADSSPVLLTPDELHQFVRLYRKTSADLALARTQSSNITLIEFLNDLTGRAYVTLYRPVRGSIGKAIGDSVALYARTVRKLQAFFFISLALFLGSVLFVYGILSVRPDLRNHFVPSGWEEVLKHWKYGEMEERSGAESIKMAGFYSSNNPMQAMRTGASAIGTFGIGAVQSNFTNGALLGALAHDLSDNHRVLYLIEHITPHGVTEIQGLVLASAAGMAMGWAMINPGRRKRGEALRESAKDAIVVLLGATVLMFIASPIEAFFSFNPRVPMPFKIAFSVLSLAAWITFYVGCGRTPEEVS